MSWRNRGRRASWWVWLLCVFAALISPASVHADGGRVELSQSLGDQRVTVFSSPTPLIVGEVDISVLVQAADGTVIRNQDVRVVCRHSQSDDATEYIATHDQATNQLLHCARVPMTEPGQWEITVKLGDDATQQVHFALAVLEPSVLPSAQWLIALAPLGFIVVYLLRERVNAARRHR